MDTSVLAGSFSTALFVFSYLPMLVKAARTRDLDSYSRSQLVLATVGNAVNSLYVFNLPMGPIWFLRVQSGLHAARVGLASALRRASPQSRARRLGNSHRCRSQRGWPTSIYVGPARSNSGNCGAKCGCAVGGVGRHGS